MHKYAQLSTEGVCIAVSNLSGKIVADNVVNVTQLVDEGMELDDFLWRKYENGVWSEEKYEPEQPEPEPTPEQIRIEQLERDNAQLRIELTQVKSDSADTTLILLELFEMLAG